MVSEHGVVASAGGPTDSIWSGRVLRRWWGVVTSFLVAAIFAQAVFAGLMLSGVDWARTAHTMGAVALIAVTLGAGVVSIATLRRVSNGVRLSLTLLALAVAVLLQTAVGKLSVEGANLMWLHVPIGVALVGFAVQAVAAARQLGVSVQRPASLFVRGWHGAL